jgi:predicted HAD superfamily phosphohydrolase YqeG
VARIKGRVMTRHKARLAREAGQLQLVKSFLDFEVPEGIVLLLTDIENTAALRGEGVLGNMVLAKFRELKADGVRYVVLRTNKMKKLVKKSVKDGTSPYYSGRYTGDFDEMVDQLEEIFGAGHVLLRQPQKTYWPPWAAGKWPRKPWRSTFRSDLFKLYDELWGNPEGAAWKAIDPSEIMAVGDKLRFDVLRPLLMGWNVALVNPMGDDGKGDNWAQIRRIERFTLRRLGLKRP